MPTNALTNTLFETKSHRIPWIDVKHLFRAVNPKILFALPKCMRIMSYADKKSIDSFYCIFDRFYTQKKFVFNNKLSL